MALVKYKDVSLSIGDIVILSIRTEYIPALKEKKTKPEPKIKWYNKWKS